VYLETELKGGRLKSLRRLTRRLQEMGEVGWRALSEPDLPEAAVDRFLELEHLGWKGTEGTSLRSQPEDEAFFREVIDGFRSEGRAWFTELSLNGTVISSTSNFVSGRAGFAFKIGWDPAYAKLSPGMLNEIELIRRAPELFGELEYLDSGAGEGSYIEEFWTGRRALTSGIFATTALGRKALAFVDAARGLKRRLRRPV
jgi:CelD/BcsL family acetyltransferase involved in cellulose biosynthesis